MKTAALSTDANAGVWIDHRRARIVGLTPDGAATMLTILSKVEKHLERAGDAPLKGAYEASRVPADDSRQRALTHKLNMYYDAVIAALRNFEKILVCGPGEAKSELHARLLKMSLGDRVAAVQTEGRMTDHQITAKVREHFGFAALRRQPPQ